MKRKYKYQQYNLTFNKDNNKKQDETISIIDLVKKQKYEFGSMANFICDAVIHYYAFCKEQKKAN
jgi:hypothetical protein